MPRNLLLVKLRRMGLLQRKGKRSKKDKKAGKRSTGGGGRRRGEGGGSSRVDVALLRRLYEEHKAHPDHLNTIAALLPGGKTVKQVGAGELPWVGQDGGGSSCEGWGWTGKGQEAVAPREVVSWEKGPAQGLAFLQRMLSRRAPFRNATPQVTCPAP